MKKDIDRVDKNAFAGCSVSPVPVPDDTNGILDRIVTRRGGDLFGDHETGMGDAVGYVDIVLPDLGETPVTRVLCTVHGDVAIVPMHVFSEYKQIKDAAYAASQELLEAYGDYATENQRKLLELWTALGKN